jgi:hypothetical protein
VVLSNRSLWKGVALASLCALAACKTYVNGNGVYDEELRDAGPFVGIAVDLGVLADVEVGEATSVLISGDANLIPDIETRVEDGVLVVGTWLDGFDPSLPLRLAVTTPYLEIARAAGASDLEVFGAEVSVSFEARAVERSAIHLAGAGGPALAATLEGGSHLEASNFPAGEAAVSLGGGSVAELRVSGEVTGTLSGGSDLRIYGGGNCSLVTASGDSTCTAPGP